MWGKKTGMLTIVFVSSRGLFPFTDSSRILTGAESNLGMYDVLAESLKAQTCKDYQVVVVDKFNPIPRPEVVYATRGSIGGSEFYRPRQTPWTRMGAFAACAARNVGLIYARGETVLHCDDGYSFGPRTVERVLQLAAEGKSAVPMLRHIGGDAVYGIAPTGEVPYSDNVGGMVSFPLADAIAINGWDERFDGCRLSEDVDTNRRLMKHGVRFWRDDDVWMQGLYHAPSRAKHLRCPILVMELSERRRGRGELRGNVPWSADELAMFETCGRAERRCSITGAPCGQSAVEDEVARRLRLEYEAGPAGWLDVAAERARVGVL